MIWQIYDGRITWLYLNEGRYTELPTDENGVIRSRTFPGLWLDADALLSENLAAVLATVQAGLANST